MDLFENFEELPQIVQDIINSHGDDFTYKSCEALLAKLSVFGYTFEYGLDAVPYDLRKVLTIDDFDDVVEGEDSPWSQLCTRHAKRMTKEGTGGIDTGGSGICGVKGCNHESEYYIDF